MSTIELDPVEDHLEARHLSALAQRWLASKRVAPVTLVTYHNKIGWFLAWWDLVGPDLDWRLTQSALGDFELYLRGALSKLSRKPLSYGNRHAIIRTVRMMFKWAAKTNRTVRNYGEWVPWPSGHTPPRKSATVEHLAQLMLTASTSPTPVRDQAMIAFFIGTGCRLCEVASLSVEDLKMFTDDSGIARVCGKRTKANPSGERSIAFDAATGRYLLHYMAAMGVTAGRLWVSRKRGRLCRMAVYGVVRRTVAKAGLGGHIRGCHDLRRAFATILGLLHPESPGWADLIRRQLGHKHYRQTAAYTLVEVDDIRKRLITPLSLNQP